MTKIVLFMLIKGINMSGAVARVVYIDSQTVVARAILVAHGNRDFRNFPTYQDAVEIPVPALVYRGATRYQTFAIVQKTTLLHANDIVRCDRGTRVGIEFLDGGKVNLKKGSTAKLTVDGHCLTLDHGDWHKIVLNSGGAWAKFRRVDKPLTVQSHGGLLGIKG